MSLNIIWTTNNCLFCNKAKELLDNANIKYEARLVDGGRWSLNDLLNMVPDAETYPQIFLGEKYIGGCDDLEAYFVLQEMSL